MNDARAAAQALQGLALFLGLAAAVPAADQPQWGQRHTRNMVSAETGLSRDFDPGRRQPDGSIALAEDGGVRWVARLGSEAYASPVVARGTVLVGTNNRPPRDPRHQGDRGVLLCLQEATGRLLWQLVVPKLTAIKNADWHYVGICSPPSVQGDRAYLVSNRGEVLCLDLDGLADGNDGPFRDEGRHMTPPGREPIALRPTDADIVWLYDMVAELGVRPHNASAGSVLIHGDLLYATTGNGVEWTHRRPANPAAPSLIVLHKRTGALVAQDAAAIGPHIFHGTWSSPALGTAGGRDLVVFGGGDGVCYAFAALPSPEAAREGRLETVWSFRCDPEGREVPGWASRMPPDPRGPSTIIGMPVFHEGRVYVAAGGDPWHGKRAGALHCIEATGRGDLTTSGRRWSYDALGQCISTVAVGGGLVYVAGYDGRLHCLDAATGQPCWVHRARGPLTGSPLLADGVLTLGTSRGDLWILAAGRDKRVLARIHLPSGICTTPVAANGALYIATRTHLYAIPGRPRSAD